MGAVERTHQDITKFCTITNLLYTSLNYQQIVLHICSILANLRVSLYYMRQVAMHVLDNIDKISRNVNTHQEALPSAMHLPILSEETPYFYRYLCTHILIADKQFLLLINVPIQDHTQQLKIYEVFLHENIQYGTPWSQHYTFGWQISNHMSSEIP